MGSLNTSDSQRGNKLKDIILAGKYEGGMINRSSLSDGGIDFNEIMLSDLIRGNSVEVTKVDEESNQAMYFVN